MPIRLDTVLKKIERMSNRVNSDLLKDFYQHMKDNGTSQNYQKGNLKAMVHFAEHIGGTPEATRNVLEKEAIGISEALRMHGQKRTPLSMLSRGAAGVRGKTVIVNLPGSVKAVSESLDALIPGILHASKMLGGHGH